MRKPVLLFALFPLLATAQVVFQDDFEGYSPGTYVAENSNGNWRTWDNSPGTPEDATANGLIAHGGAVSAEIFGPSASGPVDFVHDFGGLTGGHYQLSFWIRVENNAGGYFNLMHNGDPANLSFALESYFSNDGTGYMMVNSVQYPFTHTQGEWNEVKFDINMADDEAEFFMNGTSIHQWQWSMEADSPSGLNQLDWADFFAAAAGTVTPSHYYIDDFTLENVANVGIADVLANTSGVYPTPARNQVTIDLATTLSSTATVEMFDMAGTRTEVPVILNTTNVSFNIARLQPGVYFVRINDGGETLVKKVVKN